MPYQEQIQSLQNPTFQKIRRIAFDSIAHLSNAERTNFYNQLNRGVDILETNELLCQYLWSYGNMHEDKMRRALSSISNPQQVFSNDLAIVDWGCGQGLATVCFFDFLKQHNIANCVRNIILIEPSKMALERAKFHTNAYPDFDTGCRKTILRH